MRRTEVQWTNANSTGKLDSVRSHGVIGYHHSFEWNYMCSRRLAVSSYRAWDRKQHTHTCDDRREFSGSNKRRRHDIINAVGQDNLNLKTWFTTQMKHLRASRSHCTSVCVRVHRQISDESKLNLVSFFVALRLIAVVAEFSHRFQHSFGAALSSACFRSLHSHFRFQFSISSFRDRDDDHFEANV